MVTITAPGVEMKEIDLSFYDFPQAEEDTQNVLITGFSPKGITRVPVKFTSNNTTDDLIDTFGVPKTEAERYFFNACSEAIKRDKVVLYAVRLPYNNGKDNNFRTIDYTLTVSSDKIGNSTNLKVISTADSTLSTKYYATIENPTTHDAGESLENIEKYRSGLLRPLPNHFKIVEKNQSIFEKIPVDSTHLTDESREVIGILPVVTTAANAMYYQKLIDCKVSDISKFEPTNALYAKSLTTQVDKNVLVYPIAQDTTKATNDEDEATISKFASQMFPTISMNDNGSFASDRLKNIGVVVFKGYVDAEYNGKVKYEIAEAFAGSLKQDDVDPTTGESRFIDDIINTNSTLIEFYSNCFNETITTSTVVAAKNVSVKQLSVENAKDSKQKTTFAATSNTISYSDIGIFYVNNINSYALGFEEATESEKIISPTLILQSLDKAFAKINNVNSESLDLVVDAGIANIADFMHLVNDNSTTSNFKTYEPTGCHNSVYAAQKWDVCLSRNDGTPTSQVKPGALVLWQAVLKKYDEFCKKRGDCMFLADGPRPLCVQGNRKRVRGNNYITTVTNTILPFMKYISGKVNTSYGAGYCDWYQIVDPTSQVNIWMPPSVAAMQTYLDVTNSKYYWSTPAGVNNGKMNYAQDIAFNPTVEEAGGIYDKCWNYCSYYRTDGFVLEGNKTFLIAKTAFDRVNVRRLFLYLERKTFNAAKYFIYEGNTSYTRQKLVDAIKPYFDDAKVNGGLYDYRIQCDEDNNTTDTIDRNELHVKIAIKPTKAIEFIECTFVALRTGGSFTEAGMKE